MLFGLHLPTLPSRPLTGLAAFNVHSSSTGVLRLGFAFGPSRRSVDPAGNTTSADFSTASQRPLDPGRPAPPREPKGRGIWDTREISAGKTSNLHRTPTAFTERPLDDIGLRLVVQTRPDRPALYAQPTAATKAPMRHVFLGSRLRTPASSPPSLTTEQLPSACGWCHQPPQGTRTPELLVMSRAHRACGCRDRNQARAPRGDHAPTGHVS